MEWAANWSMWNSSRQPYLYVFSNHLHSVLCATRFILLTLVCFIVVVARSDKLRSNVRGCQNFDRGGPPPSHRDKNAYNAPVDCHWSDHRCWPCVLVRPDFAMQTGVVFLEPIITWGERNLSGCGHYHRHRLSLQCNCHTVRLRSRSLAHLAGLEVANDAENENCVGCYSEFGMHVCFVSKSRLVCPESVF